MAAALPLQVLPAIHQMTVELVVPVPAIVFSQRVDRLQMVLGKLLETVVIPSFVQAVPRVALDKPMGVMGPLCLYLILLQLLIFRRARYAMATR